MWGTKAPHVNVGKNVCLHNQHFPNASSASKMYVGKLAYIKCSRKHRGNATVWFGKLQIAKVRRQQKKRTRFCISADCLSGVQSQALDSSSGKKECCRTLGKRFVTSTACVEHTISKDLWARRFLEVL